MRKGYKVLYLGGEMMALSEPGVQFSTDFELAIDWPTFASNIAQGLVHGVSVFFGNSGGSINSLASFGAAATAIRRGETAGTQAWNLFWLSFGWSITQVRVASGKDAEIVRRFKALINETKATFDHTVSHVPLHFLERPLALPLYQGLREQLTEQKALFGSPDQETFEQFAAKLDAAFAAALFAVLSKSPDSYNLLVSSLRSPGSEASSFEFQWQAYRGRLIYDFEVQPIFGQEETKFALAQAYIPLRCHWRADDAEQAGEDLHYRRFAWLDEHLNQWVSEPCTLEKSIKLLGGGPGSGKSTSLKRLAKDLANDPSVRPLFIPLQHVDLKGALRDSINQYFTTRTNSAFTSPPLSRAALEDGPPLVLIFDGLDEIARPGESADEIANLFVTKLDQLCSALNGDGGKQVKVIVSGRMPSFQAARKFRGALQDTAIEVIGYAPFKVDDDEIEYGQDILEVDQRSQWWSKISKLFGLPKELPEALTDERLEEVTNEPLLSYLMVLSGLAVDKWEEAAENRNKVYEHLIDEVWRRGWGDPTKAKDRQGAGKSLSKADFNQLMETIALAAWLGGDARVASDEKFKESLKILRTQSAWEEFKKDGGDDVTNLAMNFYMKASDEAKRGFEFTHKSFGEYLAARAIVALSLDVCELVDRYPDKALETWLESMATGVMTGDMLTYLRDEFRKIASISDNHTRCQKTQRGLEQLCRLSVVECLPAHRLGSKNWRELVNFFFRGILR